MKIERITNKEELEKYNILASRYGCVFNTPEWLAIYGEALKLMGIYNDNHELTGAFFLYESSRFGLQFSITPPFTPHNGFFENRAQNKANRYTYAKNILEAIAIYIEQRKDALFVSAFPFKLIDTQIFFWKNFKVIPNYTYRINLLLSEEELLNNLTSEKRKSLKKAGKDGLRIEQTYDYKVVKELILKTFSRKEKPLNKILLDKILFDFSVKENSFAYIAHDRQGPIATTFCVCDQETAYYLFGGYDAGNKHHGAGVSTMWASVMHARASGLKVFDFEGSMLPEVEKYFREFGGELTPYYTVNKAWLPFEMLLKLKKRMVF